MEDTSEIAAGLSPATPAEDRQPPKAPLGTYLSRDLARLYGIHVWTVRKREQEGKIPKRLKGYDRPLRWSKRVVDEHLRSLHGMGGADLESSGAADGSSAEPESATRSATHQEGKGPAHSLAGGDAALRQDPGGASPSHSPEGGERDAS